MKINRKGLLIYTSIFLLVLLSVSVFSALQPKQKKIAYSGVIGYFESSQVKEYTLNMGNGDLSVALRDGGKFTYTVPDISLFVNQVEPIVNGYNNAHPGSKITYDYIQAWQAPWWLGMLPYLLIFGGVAAVWIVLRRRGAGAGGGNVMSFGKSNVKTAPDSKNQKTFNDVAGADEEKEELNEIVGFLKNPQKYNGLGARIPKGVLLIGPPGTGKTLLAKAVAGEAGVPFFPISGSDFVEMFVGVGASRVRDLFEKAKKAAPCIIFIDEIDAVGRHRGAELGGGNDEREQTLNQLLVEMDGFGVNEGVIVIAATNRADILDPALMRPGRFDRQVFVGAPDIKGREAVLRVHSRGKPFALDVNFNEIAKATVGFTGADLENLLNEAALLAARRGKQIIGMAEIEESVIKVVAGPEKKSRVISGKEKKLTAYHEAGHAVVTTFLLSQSPVQQVSIIPRGRMGGFTLTPPEEDKNYATKNEMLEQICVLLGGRAAESIVLDDISTGASSDIERATKIARSMVTKYGMSDQLGPVAYAADNEEVFLGRDYAKTSSYSDRVSAEIDLEIRGIISSAYDKAKEILTKHIDHLHEVAMFLFQNEKMSGVELKNILSGDTAGLRALPAV